MKSIKGRVDELGIVYEATSDEGNFSWEKGFIMWAPRSSERIMFKSGELIITQIQALVFLVLELCRMNCWRYHSLFLGSGASVKGYKACIGLNQLEVQNVEGQMRQWNE